MFSIDSEPKYSMIEEMSNLQKVLWWVYFVFFVLTHGSVFFGFVADWYIILLQIITLLSMLCLNGYIVNNLYLNRIVWKAFFIFLFLWLLVEVYMFYHFPLLSNSVGTSLLAPFFPSIFKSISLFVPFLEALGYGFMIPLYVAAYRYGFKITWKSPNKQINSGGEKSAPPVN